MDLQKPTYTQETHKIITCIAIYFAKAELQF